MGIYHKRVELQTELKLLAETEIPEGTSGRFVCLICNGGSNNEKSLAVTRAKGKILYKCFRDTCGISGCIKQVGGLENNNSTPSKPPRLFKGETFNLDYNELQLFVDLYGLRSGVTCIIRYSPEDDRYLLPIKAKDGKHRGWIARSLSGAIPKALTYKEATNEPWLGWFETGLSPIVVVEDWFSAAKVFQAGYTAVTISGTHIGWDEAIELGVKERTIILALDKGTMPTMLRLKTRYEPIWAGCRILKLDRDLKYESEERIRDAIEFGKALDGGSS